MSEKDPYYGYGEQSIVELAESLKYQNERLDEAKSWASVIPKAERHIEAIKRRMRDLLSPEQPQDTDSTGTVETESPRVFIAEGGEVEWSEPVQPMADLSCEETLSKIEETWNKLEEINERNFPDLRSNGGYTPPPAETD